MNLLTDILKVNDPEKNGNEKYSQARVYKLITFIVLLGVLISSLFIDVDKDIIVNTTDTLFYMLLIFGGYSLTGKGLSTMKKK